MLLMLYVARAYNCAVLNLLLFQIPAWWHIFFFNERKAKKNLISWWLIIFRKIKVLFSPPAQAVEKK
jgi:hypothetical protein